MRRQLTLLGYEIKYAWLGIRRHFLLSLSALSAVAIALLLVGIFLIAGLHIEHFSNNVEDELLIHVVLDPSVVDQSELDTIRSRIEEIPNVVQVDFSSKEDELQLMIKEKGEAFAMYEGEQNPLGNAFFVSVAHGDDLSSVNSQIDMIQGVSSTAYGGVSVRELVEMLTKVRTFAAIGIALLLVLSFYLIYNTIRTTIYSRSDDIIIMRQVGAENSFVKRPFEIEGLMISLCGALLPFMLIWWIYPKFYETMNGRLFASVFELIEPNTIDLWCFGLMIGTAAIIGIQASFLAVTKYLKAKR